MTTLSPNPATVIRTDAARARAAGGLSERISARISASIEEIAPFATVEAALDRIAARYLAGKRVVIAPATGEALAARAWAVAGSAKVAAAPSGDTTLDALVAAAREADVVVLSSPLLSAAAASPFGFPATLSPRELLLLRSRAPRPLILLDLVDEEYARTPLTQPALLLPGTVVLRGFGRAWAEVGAAAVAPLAFVAGPQDLVTALEAPPLDPELEQAASAELDRPDIDRAVRAGVLDAPQGRESSQDRDASRDRNASRGSDASRERDAA